jgi:hypothetical protein
LLQNGEVLIAGGAASKPVPMLVWNIVQSIYRDIFRYRIYERSEGRGPGRPASER